MRAARGAGSGRHSAALRSMHIPPLFRPSAAAPRRCEPIAVRIIPRENFAAVRAHDSVADAQSEAGALAHFFRREKRIEDAVDLRDARAVVAETISILSERCDRLDFDFPGAPRFLHGVVRIVQDVQKHLLQLVRIADHHGQVLRRILR